MPLLFPLSVPSLMKKIQADRKYPQKRQSYVNFHRMSREVPAAEREDMCPSVSAPFYQTRSYSSFSRVISFPIFTKMSSLLLWFLYRPLFNNQCHTHQDHEAESRHEVPLREDKALAECEPVNREQDVIVFILLGDEVSGDADEQCLDGYTDCPEAHFLQSTNPRLLVLDIVGKS